MNISVMLAGIISGVGYLGFTSSQFLAGAKLASAAFVGLICTNSFNYHGVFIAVVYTVLGGIKASHHMKIPSNGYF